MKVIVSESVLNELQTRKNPRKTGAESQAYLGSNWVKKFAHGGEYNEENLLQYELMEENPDIFPETRIKTMNNGSIIVLQRKVDVSVQEQMWEKVSRAYHWRQFNTTFRTLLEGIAEQGLTSEWQEIIDWQIQYMRDNEIGLHDIRNYDANQIIGWFQEYINLCNNLHEITKNDFVLKRYQMDLHDENFGLDGGKLKIIDFISALKKKT